MKLLQPVLLLLALALPLGAQPHSEPHLANLYNHNHNQIRDRALDFGTVMLPPGASGSVSMASSGGALPVATSPLWIARYGSSWGTAGPATYRISGTTTLYHETRWMIRQPPASCLTFNLYRIGGGGSVQVTLTPLPSPSGGNYIPAGAAVGSPYRSDPFYWGGTVTIPAGTPEGDYTAVTPTFSTTGPNPWSPGPYIAFVITEDFCDANRTLGVSDEQDTFRVYLTIQAADATGMTAVKNSDLHFGVLSVPQGASGTVTVYPDGVTPRSSTGSLVLLPRAPFSTRALFTISPPSNTYIQFVKPGSTTLTRTAPVSAPAPTMTANLFTWQVGNARASGTSSDFGGSASGWFLSRNTSTAAAREVSFGIGATLNVGVDQPGGTYQGNFSVTFAYR